MREDTPIEATEDLLTALSFRFEREALGQTAAGHREAYPAARPFPHVVLDNFFPPEVLDVVLSEFPNPADAEWWVFQSEKERKLASLDDAIMGPATRHLLSELNSSTLLRFLEDLTGISGLIPDPHFVGGGLHQIERGGYLKVHADFNRHAALGLYRRINLLVYLNREWADNYGGHLELWERDASRCVTRIAPIFNRCVVFNTDRSSLHGHPHPLECPPDRTRRSLALYYYTVHPASDDDRGHNTLFADGRGEVTVEAEAAAWKRAARRIVPPVAVDALSGLRRRLRP